MEMGKEECDLEDVAAEEEAGEKGSESEHCILEEEEEREGEKVEMANGEI